MMHIAWQSPYWLALLPLVLAPWLLGRWRRTQVFASFVVVPADSLSALFSVAHKLLASIAIAALVVTLAQPQRRDVVDVHASRGAEIVMVIDKSRSMDQTFVRRAERGPNGCGACQETGPVSKIRVAKQLLADFVNARSGDIYGMVTFSAAPVAFLPLTDNMDVVRAAINALDVGRGLGDTDIGSAMLEAARYFDDRSYSGSRVILLVSDGGAQIDDDVRSQLTSAFRRNRTAIYWIYLRSLRSPGLMRDRALTDTQADAVPEHFLDKYLASVGVPYRAYEAEDPEAVQRAVEDIGRMHALPIAIARDLPNQPVNAVSAAVALAAVLLLALLEMARVDWGGGVRKRGGA